MSRIGKRPIQIPEGVEVKLEGDLVIVKGQKGELKSKIRPEIKVEIEDKVIRLKPIIFHKGTEALWGTYYSLIINMIKGVTRGFEKKLEIEGVGYRAAVEGNKLILSLGFSHSVEIKAPEGLKFNVEENVIIVSGTDKQLIGQIAADIRSKREPEPYRGKGIKYQGEIIRRKAGKKAAATA